MAPWADDVIAASGVMMEGAGCLFIPFLPVRAGGRLTVTPTRVEFVPILHWSWFSRPVTMLINDIAHVDLSGSGVQLSIRDLVAIGKRMTITMRDGRRYNFRGMQIEEVYLTLQQTLGGGDIFPPAGD